MFAARSAVAAPSVLLPANGLRSVDADVLPDLYIAGLPKSGTWWLADNLARHPGVFLGESPEPGKREVRYFTLRSDRPLSYYTDIFEPGRDRCKVDKSPDYCTMSLRRIRLLRALKPEARAILILRDPVERAFSHAKQEVLWRSGRSFEDTPLHEFSANYRTYCALYDYAAIVERWRRVFGQDDLLVLDFRAIERRPAEVLEEVLTFVGLDPARLPTDEHALHEAPNPNMPMPIPPGHRRLIEVHAAASIAFYEALFPDAPSPEGVR